MKRFCIKKITFAKSRVINAILSSMFQEVLHDYPGSEMNSFSAIKMCSIFMICATINHGKKQRNSHLF